MGARVYNEDGRAERRGLSGKKYPSAIHLSGRIFASLEGNPRHAPVFIANPIQKR
jgi:hypothetical protein